MIDCFLKSSITQKATFEREAAEFSESLRKDIDFVESMATEFELKAERALAERRRLVAEERRSAVQQLCVRAFVRCPRVLCRARVL